MTEMKKPRLSVSSFGFCRASEGARFRRARLGFSYVPLGSGDWPLVGASN